ncbi:hypothetical protein FRB94_010527 [Tulasnella sp. JGI-2019a]|nr:hypothetical protein FRB94_010527 [Tulasnella sp. JGI-2019a]KAG9007775.1 hypothetical protein FRB93_007166 [Tulasnella sp. JGI-2019a]
MSFMCTVSPLLFSVGVLSISVHLHSSHGRYFSFSVVNINTHLALSLTAILDNDDPFVDRLTLLLILKCATPRITFEALATTPDHNTIQIHILFPYNACL